MKRQQDLSQIFADCLQKLEAGYTTDQILAEYPDQASQLSSLLEVFLAVKPAGQTIRVPVSAQVDSRRRFLNQASQLKQRRSAASFWAALHFVRYHLASAIFAIAAVALLIVAFGSAGALPGDELYPVKLTAEEIGASLAGRSSDPQAWETTADQRRLREVVQMIENRRTGAVSFSGFLDPAQDSGWLISGIPLVLGGEQLETASGMNGGYVDVKGIVNRDGQVEVTQIQPRLVTLNGSLQTQEESRWVVDNTIILLTQVTRINGAPQIGSQVTIQAVRTRDAQQVLAVEISATDGAIPEPSATLSATVQPSKTPQPTATPSAALTLTPEINAMPIPTQTSDDHETEEPSDDSGGDEDGEESNENNEGHP